MYFLSEYLALLNLCLRTSSNVSIQVRYKGRSPYISIELVLMIKPFSCSTKMSLMLSVRHGCYKLQETNLKRPTRIGFGIRALHLRWHEVAGGHDEALIWSGSRLLRREVLNCLGRLAYVPPDFGFKSPRLWVICSSMLLSFSRLVHERWGTSHS